MLQSALAKYMTVMVHSEDDYNKAVSASNILFGKGTTDMLMSLDERTLLGIMKDVNKVEVQKAEVVGMPIVDLASVHAKIASKTEVRKLIKSNGLSVNKQKVSDVSVKVDSSMLMGGKYVLLQKGKKDYVLVVAN